MIFIMNAASATHIMPINVVLLMWEAFLFSLLDECRDVNHDDDKEEAHENRAADEKCDMAFAVCGPSCCHVAWQCRKSDKQQHSEYESCDVSRDNRCDVHVRSPLSFRLSLVWCWLNVRKSASTGV